MFVLVQKTKTEASVQMSGYRVRLTLLPATRLWFSLPGTTSSTRHSGSFSSAASAEAHISFASMMWIVASPTLPVWWAVAGTRSSTRSYRCGAHAAVT